MVNRPRVARDKTKTTAKKKASREARPSPRVSGERELLRRAASVHGDHDASDFDGLLRRRRVVVGCERVEIAVLSAGEQDAVEHDWCRAERRSCREVPASVVRAKQLQIARSRRSEEIDVRAREAGDRFRSGIDA